MIRYPALRRKRGSMPTRVGRGILTGLREAVEWTKSNNKTKEPYEHRNDLQRSSATPQGVDWNSEEVGRSS